MESGELELMDVNVDEDSVPAWLVDDMREPDESYRGFGWEESFIYWQAVSVLCQQHIAVTVILGKF